MASRSALPVIGWSFCLGASLLLGPTAAARTYGLLVGVSEYPALSQRFQLAGPANDVQMYRSLLLERGVAPADITIIADGVPEAVLPSRQAILAALEALENRIAKGDQLFVLMAGHGSQQPASKDSREPDGLDEIFLPRDVGRWQGKQGVVENAITDDEIGGALQRLRARGAFVWAVFDTCHAGTLARDASLTQQRQVPPEALGMSASVLAAARVRSKPGAGALSETPLPIGADYVYMYAAQSSELTPELPLPTNAPDARVHGLFSYTLHQVLSTSTDLSYRQAIERVMQLYLANGQQTPAPQIEGSALDTTLFKDAKPPPAAWLVDRRGTDLQLRAGQLQGITAQSILALVATPTAPEVLGYVRVTNAAAASATLVPVAHGERPALAAEQVSNGVYARPVDLKVDFSVRVGIAPGGAFCENARADLLQAIGKARREPAMAQRTRWPGAAQPADVYLCQRRGRLLFLDASANTSAVAAASAPGITLPRSATSDAFVAELQQRLTRVLRVINLARVTAANRQPAQLNVTLSRCPARALCARRSELLQPAQRAELRDGDVVTVTLTTLGTQAVDVTVLYIDAAYGISLLYPYEAGESPRLGPKDRQSFEVAINAQPSGFERLLILTAPAERFAAVTSFASLAQPALPLQATRSGAAGGLLDLLQEAAFGTSTISATRSPTPTPAQTVGITTYSWTVLPR